MMEMFKIKQELKNKKFYKTPTSPCHCWKYYRSLKVLWVTLWNFMVSDATTEILTYLSHRTWKIHQTFSQKFHPYWLLFMLLEGAIYSIAGEK